MNKEAVWLLNEKYDGIESDSFRNDLKRLDAGEPLAYVIGWVPFLNAKIFLDSRPLIPRSETEFWVNKAIEDLQKRESESLKVLDLCAGSGCIGVAVLKAFPNFTVKFAEINEAHNETIKRNVRENGIDENRIRVFNGDLFEGLEKAPELYDAILTNPPYIDPKLGERIQAEVLRFEPEEALFGGVGGAELIENILKNAPRFLKPGGILYIEHEPEQEAFMKSLLPGLASHEDQFGVIRFSTYKKPSS